MLPRNSGIAHPFLFYSTFCFCKSVIFIIKFLPQESVHYKATCNHSFFTFQLACCKSVAVEFSLKHKVPESPLFPEVSGHLNASWYYSHSLLGIIFNGFCFINLIPHFFDYLMCPYYPALYDGLLSNCYRW